MNFQPGQTYLNTCGDLIHITGVSDQIIEYWNESTPEKERRRSYRLTVGWILVERKEEL